MPVLFVATANPHKVAELSQLLGPQVVLRSMADTGTRIEVAETAPDFSGNALLKALPWVNHLAAGGAPSGVDYVLADDSGLEVDALGGAPGVHSARYAALDDGRPGNSPDAENNAKLLRRLADIPEGRRGARFRCVLVLVPVHPGWDDARLAAAAHRFEGTCEGRIATRPAGGGGFGDDPLFLPAGVDLSFAELGEEQKNRLSHRAAAAAALRRWLDGTPGTC
jgi:XTP/dITP diphosphohydrolase